MPETHFLVGFFILRKNKMKITNTAISFAIVMFISACGDNETAQTYISKAESLIAEKQNN